MDESALACGLDPIELRVRNEPAVHPQSGLPHVAHRLRCQAAAQHRATEALDILTRDGLDPALAERRRDVDPLHRLGVLSIRERAPSIARRSRNSSATSSTVRERSSVVGRGRTLSSSISRRIARSASLRVRPSLSPLARTLPRRRLKYRPSGARQRA
jgi:hypothetical protein